MIALDTDVVSLLMRPRPPRVLVERLARTPLDEQSTTAITIGELGFGAEKARRPDLLAQALRALAGVQVLPFDGRAGLAYGRTRAALERQGRRLADPDLRIAAIAMAHDAVLVTGNVRHFGRVEGLTAEDWTR